MNETNASAERVIETLHRWECDEEPPEHSYREHLPYDEPITHPNRVDALVDLLAAERQAGRQEAVREIRDAMPEEWHPWDSDQRDEANGYNDALHRVLAILAETEGQPAGHWEIDSYGERHWIAAPQPAEAVALQATLADFWQQIMWTFAGHPALGADSRLRQMYMDLNRALANQPAADAPCRHCPVAWLHTQPAAWMNEYDSQADYEEHMAALGDPDLATQPEPEVVIHKDPPEPDQVIQYLSEQEEES